MASNPRILQKHFAKLKEEVTEHPINVRFYVHDGDLKHIYFCVFGHKDTPYQGGEFYGEVTLPEDYPFSPPKQLIMHTPNGRYEIGKAICLTNTSFHPESWSPMWGLYKFMDGFMTTFTDPIKTRDGVGHLRLPDNEIRVFASASKEYNRTHYRVLSSASVLAKIDHIFATDATVFPPIDRTMYGTGTKDSPVLSVVPSGDASVTNEPVQNTTG
jgi:ubiquitin-conjugating enzyme E2 J2